MIVFIVESNCKRSAPGEEEIELPEERVDLKCPYSLEFIKIPARGENCKHTKVSN